jgi:hypothetical protein
MYYSWRCGRCVKTLILCNSNRKMCFLKDFKELVSKSHLNFYDWKASLLFILSI